MLKPNEIPSDEPLIRVGIILPVDNFNKLTLEIPDHFDYLIASEEKQVESKNKLSLIFSTNDDSITLYEIGISKCWKITPSTKYEISPQSGIKVKNVVAGRGFHWQKAINVFLSGSIEISNIDG
ncbi:MAG: hypothetical protein KAS18_05685, partial [Calditrichia bacterium]|nr:hypothetical protein [Calditrichia bacterium]